MVKFQSRVAFLCAWLTMLTHFGQTALRAQNHVIPLWELQSELETNAQRQARDRADITRVLSLPAARGFLDKSKISPTQVQTVVAMLSPEELSRMATQARLVERDVQGGFIVGILALIGLIAVILIVVAVVHK